MKYILITDKDENGKNHINIINGDSPEKAFEKWYLEYYTGVYEWYNLEFGGTFPARNTFKEVKIYRVIGDVIDFDYSSFIDEHDKRENSEKDPEYKEYLRLKNKFEV